MADTNVSSQVNFDAAIRDVNQRLQQLKDMTPALEEIGQMMVLATKQRIERTKIDPVGTPWRPWRPRTAQARERKGNVHQGLLYDSGSLLNSINYRLVRNSVEIFSDLPYAQYLQFGTPNMPARKFLGWSEENKVTMADIVNKHLAMQK